MPHIKQHMDKPLRDRQTHFREVLGRGESAASSTAPPPSLEPYHCSSPLTRPELEGGLRNNTNMYHDEAEKSDVFAGKQTNRGKRGDFKKQSKYNRYMEDAGGSALSLMGGNRSALEPVHSNINRARQIKGDGDEHDPGFQSMQTASFLAVVLSKDPNIQSIDYNPDLGSARSYFLTDQTGKSVTPGRVCAAHLSAKHSAMTGK
jgi:hypothetical protein